MDNCQRKEQAILETLASARMAELPVTFPAEQKRKSSGR
jgi:hypothetical protein